MNFYWAACAIGADPALRRTTDWDSGIATPYREVVILRVAKWLEAEGIVAAPVVAGG